MKSAFEEDSPVAATRLIFRNGWLSPFGGVSDCGFIKNGTGIQTESRTLDQFALVYLAHGSGTYRDERTTADLVAGDMIVLFPGVPHWYGPDPGKPFDTLHALFEGPIFDLLQSAGLLSIERPIFNRTPIRYWLESFEKALGRGNQGELTGALRETVDLQAFLLRCLLDESQPSDEAWLAQAKELLAQTGDVRRAAQRLNVSYDTFRRRFASRAGISPARYAREKQVDAACELLASTDLTIQAVAHQLGFADELYFSRAFKQVAGVPPRAFRQRYR